MVTASAHTPAASISCTSWSFGGTAYDANAANTYSYSIDGAPAVNGTFGAAFGPITGTFAVGSGNHTLSGYVYENGDPDAQYSHDYNESTSDCVTTTQIPVPAAPTPTAPTCTMAGAATIPADTDTVHWALNGDVATATAQGNNEFVGGGTTRTFTETVLPQLDANNDTCANHVGVVVPVFTNGSCSSAPTLANAVDGTGYTAVVTGTPGFGNTVTVTYTALPGYSLTGTTTYTFTYTAKPDCHVIPDPPVTPVPPVIPVIPVPPVPVTPVQPTVTQSTCEASGTTSTAPMVAFADTSNVTYSGPAGPYVAGDSVLVTAMADTGYSFELASLPAGWALIGPMTSGNTATYSLVLADAPTCVIATVPTFADDVCKASGATGSTLTLPDTTGVDFLVDDSTIAAGTHDEVDGSTVTVHAQSQAGYTLVGPTSWTHEFDKSPSCVKVHALVLHHPTAGPTTAASNLPFTGAPIAALVLLGGAITTVGAGLSIAGRRRKSSIQPV